VQLCKKIQWKIAPGAGGGTGMTKSQPVLGGNASSIT